MSEYVFQWCEDDSAYCIFDDTGMPIMDAFKFLKNENHYSRNDQEAKAVALMYWFEFLDEGLGGLHCSRAETKHIPMFRDWLKTPPENRDMYERQINVTPHITSSTWMQYQSRVATFYNKYVLVHYPECKISWKTEVRYGDSGKKTEKMLFGEKITKVDPRTKAISPSDFKLIRDCVTNKRDELLLDLLYISGLRRGEIFNIHIEQFDNVDRSLPLFEMRIYQSVGGSKDNETKTGSRSVYIPSTLAERVGSYIVNERKENKNKHTHLFTAEKDAGGTKAGDPISGTTISSIFKRAANAAGFPNKTVHDCRHSMVTNLMSMGLSLKDVMEQAGHENPDTTQGYRSRFREASKEMTSAFSEIMKSIK